VREDSKKEKRRGERAKEGEERRGGYLRGV